MFSETLSVLFNFFQALIVPEIKESKRETTIKKEFTVAEWIVISPKPSLLLIHKCTAMSDQFIFIHFGGEIKVDFNLY